MNISKENFIEYKNSYKFYMDNIHTTHTLSPCHPVRQKLSKAMKMIISASEEVLNYCEEVLMFEELFSESKKCL